ncbi:MAG: 4-hydroxy-2-oxoheptanedioate aldolase [Candidatus Poriferisodalaceae bacterium]|jgi:4-hydroxy-2-oxoheptanedioate aldolase|tara:strand:+ start:1784 stop:2581 length:798 start_codon:yes stop_codon:yes gene_type:complete
MSNELMNKWSESIETLGTWLSIPNSHSAEALSRIGFDYVCVDMQHGVADYQIATTIIQAIELGGQGTPICRVPWNEPGIIGRMLDAGARGIIIPMVNSVAEAKSAVNAVKYPPLGARSYGPILIGARAADRGENYFEVANSETACIPMIETRQAVESIDDILQVEGVDAIYVGPADLSISYGFSNAYSDDNAGYKEVLEHIAERCAAHGKVAGIHSTAGLAANRRAKGFSMQTISGDMVALGKGSRNDLKAARSGGDGDGDSKIY